MSKISIATFITITIAIDTTRHVLLSHYRLRHFFVGAAISPAVYKHNNMLASHDADNWIGQNIDGQSVASVQVSCAAKQFNSAAASK